MGKGGKGDKKDVSSSSPADKLEVIIDGRKYDVSNMKHPGGSVIKFYTNNGIDATQAFNNFHLRSKKAKKYLDGLSSVPVDDKLIKSLSLPGQDALVKEFEEFTAQLRREGFFEPSLPHTLYRLTEIVVMHAVGFWLLFNGYTVPAIIILGVVSGRCGWLMHEGGHNSLTGMIPVDRTLQIVLYGMGCGMSGSWWRNQHNKHHSMPQKLGHDVDLNTLPLVAFTTGVCKRLGSVGKLWIRMQAALFPVITTLLVALGWQFFLHPRHVLRTKNWAEAVSMGLRYVLWSIFITPMFGGRMSFLLYLAYTWVGANYIFLNFALSHTHLPVVPKDDVTVRDS
jgi:fatty acid desaturase 2 (delta-6 desaturase)